MIFNKSPYGNSTGGAPNENKVYEDAESAWNYLVGQRGISPSRLFIYGHLWAAF
ncbi:hypothetical protein [Sphingobium sp.]|uniref:hypothetical protein n=1 Tax=Sphingobium sp. TaxID=1912891 RepID=UPI003BB652FA